MKREYLRLKALSKSDQALAIVASLSKIKSKAFLKLFPESVQSSLGFYLKENGSDLKARHIGRIPPTTGQPWALSLLVVPEKLSAFEALELSRKLLASAVQTKTASLGLVFAGSPKDDVWAECLGAALAARLFLMPAYGKKAKDQKPYQLSKTQLFSDRNFGKNFDYGFESGQGSNLVRHLGALPANFLNPEIYGKEITKLAKENRVSTRFYSRTDLKKLKAGAFLAVNQGDPDSKGGIYELTYSPKKAKNKSFIALVGKGLCYDTGGYDIKTGGHMAGMKGDMQGSAVALASFLTAVRLKLPLKLKAYLVLTENHISPKAYKADDVIVAMNGRSIEVVNTDAEGRMVLADTLCLASKAKPDLIVDYATLTGMAVYAIGTNYAAGFTNDEKLHAPIVAAGKASGERVWTFPLDKDYEKALKSSVADTLQCSRGRGVDHILAARFLSHFVEKGVPWVHIDLAASENKGGLAHVDSDYTGFGVRWSLEFLRSKYRC